MSKQARCVPNTPSAEYRNFHPTVTPIRISPATSRDCETEESPPLLYRQSAKFTFLSGMSDSSDSGRVGPKGGSIKDERGKRGREGGKKKGKKKSFGGGGKNK